MSKALDGLFTTIIAGVMFGAGLCLTLEVLDLRTRVDNLEQNVGRGLEIHIFDDVEFGEPTLAPPRPSPVRPRAKNRSC